MGRRLLKQTSFEIRDLVFPFTRWDGKEADFKGCRQNDLRRNESECRDENHHRNDADGTWINHSAMFRCRRDGTFAIAVMVGSSQRIAERSGASIGLIVRPMW